MPSVPCVAWLNVLCGVPSPQSTFTAHGLSPVPGSENEPRLKLPETPSVAEPLPGVTVGATLLTVTLVVYSLKPLSLSMMRALTVYVPLSGNVHGLEALELEPLYVLPERSPFVQL